MLGPGDAVGGVALVEAAVDETHERLGRQHDISGVCSVSRPEAHLQTGRHGEGPVGVT